MKWLLAIAIGGTAAPPATTIPLPPAVEQDEALFCTSIKTMSAKVMAELPMMVDTVTRVDGMAAICAARTVVWSKSVVADLRSLRSGWIDRLQHQWNDSICGNSLYAAMVHKGWHFTQDLTFRSGEHIVFSATCQGLSAE